MDYSQKADEIYDAIYEIRIIDKAQFPLLTEMIENKKKMEREYFYRINMNLFLYGSSPLNFEIE